MPSAIDPARSSPLDCLYPRTVYLDHVHATRPAHELPKLPIETASETVTPTVQVACPANLLRAAYSGLHVCPARLQVAGAPLRVSTAPSKGAGVRPRRALPSRPSCPRLAYALLHCFDALHAQKAAPFFLVLHPQALDPSHAPVFLCPIRPLDRLRLSCAGRDELAGGD
jgi:hypothetical protein